MSGAFYCGTDKKTVVAPIHSTELMPIKEISRMQTVQRAVCPICGRNLFKFVANPKVVKPKAEPKPRKPRASKDDSPKAERKPRKPRAKDDSPKAERKPRKPRASKE